jgi:hypothetical protein
MKPPKGSIFMINKVPNKEYLIFLRIFNMCSSGAVLVGENIFIVTLSIFQLLPKIDIDSVLDCFGKCFTMYESCL